MIVLNLLLTWFELVRLECNIKNEPNVIFIFPLIQSFFPCHVGLSRLGMDDLNSDEDEEKFAVSENSSFTPRTYPSTVTSCTSTQVEPSTSNESLDDKCHMDATAETVRPPKALETQTEKDDFGEDKTTVVQDDTALSQTTSKDDEQSEGSGDHDTEKESREKVCKKHLASV